MAQITERISKSGEVSYLIKMSLGYDITGKQITKSKTWRPEAGMNPKQIKKELNKVATLFEASFERREISPPASSSGIWRKSGFHWLRRPKFKPKNRLIMNTKKAVMNTAMNKIFC